MALVPFIDMLTMLVVFLLVHSSDVEDPAEHQEHHHSAVGRRHEAAAVVVVMVTKEDMLVNGRSVATLAQLEASPDAVIAPLKLALQSQADKVLAGAAKEDIKEREITIMGDNSTPYTVLRKVMATATAADYGKVSLAVIQRASGGAAPAPAAARTASLIN